MGKVVTKAALRRINFQGKKVVLASGCFDLLHYAHARALERFKAMGDTLVVSVLDDELTSRLKGSSRPIIAARYRSELVSKLSSVDYVYITNLERVADKRLIKHLNPYVYIITLSPGKRRSQYKDLLQKINRANRGTRAVFVPFVTKQISTTAIITKIKTS